MVGRVVIAVGLTIPVVLGAGACATKGYVTDRVGEVNDRVSDLSEAQSGSDGRARRLDARIEEVDTTANAAIASSERSHVQAIAAARSADDAHGRLDSFTESARRLLFEIVLAEEHGEFAFGDAELPTAAQADLDALIEQLVAYPASVYLEIEGHTDGTGPAAYNERLGRRRAEAVMHYLHEQHHVPLHKMSIISYGEERPIAPNDSTEGRARNRRVVVRVLA